MAVDKRIEVEIALRDTASLTLKAIATQLENINKAMAKGGGEGKAIADGAETFKKIKETTEGIRKTTEDGGKTVVEAAEGMKLLSASLLRSAAGRILLGEEIIRFGANFVNDAMRERQQWNLLAQDTGLSEGFLSMLTQAQLKAAIDPEQARANIKNLSEGLRPMAYGHGSPMAQRLSAIGHEVYSRELTELMMAGKKEEAIRSIIAKGEEEFKKGDVEGRKFAEAVLVNPAFFKDMTHLLTTVKPAFQIALETANNWGLGWTYMVSWWSKNVTDAAKALGIDLISPRTNPYTYWLAMNADYGPLTPYLLPDEKLKAWKERSKEELNILGDILTTLQNQQNKKSLEKRWVGGSVLPGRQYMVGERGPERFRSNAGWSEIIEGPSIIEPKTGGQIETGPGYGFMDEPPIKEGSTSSFNQRFGDWPEWTPPPSNDYRSDAQRMAEDADIRGLPKIEFPSGSNRARLAGDDRTGANYNALQQALKGHPQFGIDEGENAPGYDVWSGRGTLPAPGSIQERMDRLGAGQTDEKTLEDREWLRQFHKGGLQGLFTGGTDISYSRDTMDSELGGGDPGSLGAQIEFRNVPEGVSTDADAEGFDSFTVNKTRQLEGA